MADESKKYVSTLSDPKKGETYHIKDKEMWSKLEEVELVVSNAFNEVKDSVGLTENLTLPDDFGYDSVIEAIKGGYTKTEIDNLIGNKLDSNLGNENANKYLKVDNNGDIITVDLDDSNIIEDNNIYTNKTWSSDGLNTRLSGKVDDIYTSDGISYTTSIYNKIYANDKEYFIYNYTPLTIPKTDSSEPYPYLLMYFAENGSLVSSRIMVSESEGVKTIRFMDEYGATEPSIAVSQTVDGVTTSLVKYETNCKIYNISGSELQNSISGKADTSTVTELSNTVSGLSTDINTNKNDINDIKKVIPTSATEENKLVDKASMEDAIRLTEASYVGSNDTMSESFDYLTEWGSAPILEKGPWYKRSGSNIVNCGSIVDGSYVPPTSGVYVTVNDYAIVLHDETYLYFTYGNFRYQRIKDGGVSGNMGAVRLPNGVHAPIVPISTTAFKFTDNSRQIVTDNDIDFVIEATSIYQTQNGVKIYIGGYDASATDVPTTDLYLPTTRYVCTVGSNETTAPVWSFQYIISDSSLTNAQMSALNSTIDKTKVTNYDTHIGDTTIHVTSDDKTAWNAKADTSDIPTNVSELTNDSNYVTSVVKTKSEYTALTEKDSNTLYFISDTEEIYKGENLYQIQRIVPCTFATIQYTGLPSTYQVSGCEAITEPGTYVIKGHKWDGPATSMHDSGVISGILIVIEDKDDNKIYQRFHHIFTEIERDYMERYGTVNEETQYVSWSALTLISHKHNWSDIESTPTTINGYGITDVYDKDTIDNHTNDTSIHTTSDEKNSWNAKTDIKWVKYGDTTVTTASLRSFMFEGNLSAYTPKNGVVLMYKDGDGVMDMPLIFTYMNGGNYNGIDSPAYFYCIKGDKVYTCTLQTTYNGNVWSNISEYNLSDLSNINTHIGNTTIHVTSDDKTAWNAKANIKVLTYGDTSIYTHNIYNDILYGNNPKSIVYMNYETAYDDDSNVLPYSGLIYYWDGNISDRDYIKFFAIKNNIIYTTYVQTTRVSDVSTTTWGAVTANEIQNKLSEGNNIQISGNIISALGYVYNNTLNSFATNNSTASGTFSHAEGRNTVASGSSSHAEGYKTKASNNYSHAEGQNSTASNTASHAEGSGTTASNIASHAEGKNTTASGTYSHAEGQNTIASGLQGSHAEGQDTIASGQHAHAEGAVTLASAINCHAEGEVTHCIGHGGHSEGILTHAKGEASHSEGKCTIANGINSHAEGGRNFEYAMNDISNYSSNATTISFSSSTILTDDICNKIFLLYINSSSYVCVDSCTNDNGNYTFTISSHNVATIPISVTTIVAKIYSNIANGEASHVEGLFNEANGNQSHVSGIGNIANQNYQFVCGKYNANSDNSLFIVGGGTDNSNRSNLFEVGNNGTVTASNDFSVTKDSVVHNLSEKANAPTEDCTVITCPSTTATTYISASAIQNDTSIIQITGTTSSSSGSLSMSLGVNTITKKTTIYFFNGFYHSSAGQYISKTVNISPSTYCFVRGTTSLSVTGASGGKTLGGAIEITPITKGTAKKMGIGTNLPVNDSDYIMYIVTKLSY